MSQNLFKTLITLFLSFILCACSTANKKAAQNLSTTINDNALARYLSKNNYNIWPMPDSISGAGALVVIQDGKPLPPSTDLAQCGVPASVLNVQKGSFPGIELDANSDLGLGLLAAFRGIGIDSSFGRIQKVTVNASSAGRESIDRIRVKAFLNLAENIETLDPYCRTAIEQAQNLGNVRIIVDAAFIEGGKISFFESDNLSAKLDRPAVIEALGGTSLDPSISNKVDASGDLNFDQRIYIAYSLNMQPPTSVSLGSEASEWTETTAPFH